MVFAVLTPVAARGGLQNKPVNMTTALRYADSQNVPIVLNTPFTIVKSSTSQGLTERHYEGLDEVGFSPIHFNTEANRFVTDSLGYQPNLVYIVLESIGQEMTGYYNPDRRYALTPFLDALLEHSLTFDGRANGRRSIEALPSLLSGIPSLMDVDFTSSPYINNRVDGLGKSLQERGYLTAMFHGGNNGTMNFNASALSAGFDSYYGRNEYGNDDDYDGTWGISDMPFLQFTAQKVNEMKKPFAAGVFTLSSHHPFKLPKGYKLPDGDYKTDFEKTVRYTDDAMRHFFKTMSNYSWFDSTIFVIVGDHVNPEHRFDNYLNGYGQYQIVTAFYAPSIIKPLNTNILAQQTDIGISLLAALGYNDTIFTFGRNVFDSLQEPCFASYLNNIYQYSDGKYMLQSDGQNITAIFDIEEDPCLSNNLYNENEKEIWDELNDKFRMRLQQYNNRMINNKLYIK